VATLAAVVVLGPVPVSAQTPDLEGSPICGTEAGGSGQPDDGRVRIGTFNILHTLEDDADRTLDARVELIADALAAAAVDAVGLQEVTRSANHGMVAERLARGLAGRTGDSWSWCFFQSNPHLPGEPDTGPGGVGGPVSQQIADFARGGDAPWAEGLAVLSRFPIVDQRAHRLPGREAEVPICVAEAPEDPLAGPTCAFDTRQVLWARADTPCGGLDLFSTHLAHTVSSASAQTRMTQVADALSTIAATASDDALPDVFVGDFNTLEGEPVWQAVVDAGFVDTYRVAAPDDPGLTSDQDILAPAATVTSRIDYIFAKPGTAALELAAPEVIGDAAGSLDGQPVWPSDHFGVAMTVGSSACAQPSAIPPAATVAAAPAGGIARTGGPPPDWAVAGSIAALAALVARRASCLV
jgi:endonuclease/exonuclease/phosphatase family metal-dependent hydrolase